MLWLSLEIWLLNYYRNWHKINIKSSIIVFIVCHSPQQKVNSIHWSYKEYFDVKKMKVILPFIAGRISNDYDCKSSLPVFLAIHQDIKAAKTTDTRSISYSCCKGLTMLSLSQVKQRNDGCSLVSHWVVGDDGVSSLKCLFSIGI